MADRFLDKVYQARTPDEVRALYDDWSASYDAEVSGEGYITPKRTAVALFDVIRDAQAPILDFGCGTGLSGQALTDAGFGVIDGADISAGMLARAQHRGIYRTLTQITPGADLPIAPGDYAAIAAIGVIGSGAAPLDVLRQIFAALSPGGFCAFSFNDHTLEDPSFDSYVQGMLAKGQASSAFYDYGPHLPGIGMKSAVYILEKT